MKRAAPGFTLIEVMVALTIGSLVVLAVYGTFGGATDAAARIATERAEHDARMRSRELLSNAIGSLDVITTGAMGFRGERDAVAFTALPGRLVRIGTREGWLQLVDSVEHRLLPADSVRFDYLLHAGAAEAWVREWYSPSSAPLAIRIRRYPPDATPDTMLFAIGSRG